MTDSPLQAARALLAEMKTQAADGTMIPARVPGQIDAIDALLKEAAAAQTSPPSAPALPTDAEALLAENAQFIATAVHEMRIPLTSIRGYADMLTKGMLGDLNEQQMQFMETVRSNALRMDRLIADISDVGKLRAGRLHLEQRMEMAKNPLMAAEKACAPLAEERGQTLTFDVPEGLPLLNADGDRIAQALTYLVENAINYAPEGSTVTVKALNADGTLRIDVIDAGIGMTEDEQARIGEPFWRAENETVRSVKGHGLGYAVAKGLIEAMGGAITFESAYEQGSTFTLTLPGMS